jgi:hypothetical protein
LRSFGYTRNDDWLKVSIPKFDGDAVLVEGADDRATAQMIFTAWVEVDKFKLANSLNSLELQVIAKSRYGMVYEVCVSEELTLAELDLSVDISNYRSLPDLTFEVVVLANLSEEVAKFQPGRPSFDKSILAAKLIGLSSIGVGSPYPNVQVKEFSKTIDHSIWLVEIDWNLLTASTADELSMLDISRVIALQVNPAFVEQYKADLQLQILSYFELARRSIESFFALDVTNQVLVMAQLARRGAIKNSWLQWLRWCFRSSFGTAFLEANKSNLGLVLLRWNLERDKVEAQLRSSIGKALK